MTIEKLSTWASVSNEMLADAYEMNRTIEAHFEYSASYASKAPLTAQEKLSGIRVFTASNGVVLHIPVGWRAVMRAALREVDRRKHPENYIEDDD